MFVEAALVVTVVFGTAAVVHYRRQTAESVYDTFDRWRTLIGGVVLIAIAWTFLRSGHPELIFIALVAIALATVWVMVEKPHETLV